MASSKKSQYSELPVYPSTPPKIEYELKTLPLQKEIGEARKFISHYACIAKGNLSTYTKRVKEQYLIIKGEATKYGVTKDSLAVQTGTVGGVVLLGYALGRRKSNIRKFVYPLMGGALVGGAFYLSVPGNRKDSYERLQELVKRVWPR